MTPQFITPSQRLVVIYAAKDKSKSADVKQPVAVSTAVLRPSGIEVYDRFEYINGVLVMYSRDHVSDYSQQGQAPIN